MGDEFERFNMEFGDGEQKKRRMTKDEAIYGSFLEGGSSDEDGGGGGRRRGGRGGKGGKPINLSAAPRFVSGGTVGPGSATKEKDNGESDDGEERPSMMRAHEEEEEDVSMKDLDSGLQFRRNYQRQAEEQQRRRAVGASAAQLPKNFGKGKPDRPAPVSQPQRSAVLPKQDWEKYTKGIGSKLLGKMLEKDPEKAKMGKLIEVSLLDKKQGIGFGDFSAKTAKSRAIANEWSMKAPITGKASEPDTTSAMDAQLQEMEMDDRSWRRDFQRAQPKVVYKTADEVAMESGKKELIIDMTGKEARVLGSVDEATKMATGTSSSAARRKVTSYMPELEHNVRMLLNLSEAALQNTERKIQQEKETEERARREVDRLDVVLQAEAKQIERLEEMNKLISSCKARMRPPPGEEPIAPLDLAAIFDGLFSKFREEYVVFDLSTLLYSLASTKIKQALEAWNMLAEPAAPISSFQTWRSVFTRPQKEMKTVTGVKASVPDNWTRLVVEVFLPRARSVLSTQWNPRQPEQGTRFFDAWKPLLPASVLASLLEQCVMPRLQREVDAWNPRQDPIPIHTWLHPWLPLLGARLEPLYTPLRHKLFKALEAWHPSDPSAHAILLPWRKVWEGAPLERLLNNAIVPKLNMLLQHFVINPNQQELEPFQWLMLWQDIMPLAMLVTLLEQSFFPKWFGVLHSWLRGSPNFEEVSRWYMGWKKLFPDVLQTNARMKVQFSVALDMMNKAVSGEAIPPVPAPPPLPGAPGAAPAAAPKQVRAAELSFKEVMQRFAEKNGVVFLPTTKRRHPSGKPVYSFGPVDIALDNDVIFMWTAGQWMPASMDDLAVLAGVMPV